MSVRYFEDLEVWKEARRLTKEVYAATHDAGFSKDYGLRDQIQRAAVSIMFNIAEGFERGGNQEFIQFLYEYLKGSRMKGEKFKKPVHRTMKEELDVIMEKRE